MSSKEASNSKDSGSLPVPWAHLALAVVAALPLVYQIPVSFNIVLTAALTVYVGCWRSVKPLPPVDSMTTQDALKFPLIGSGVLFGLFMVFKLLPKELINKLLTLYFMTLGCLACTATLLPFISRIFSAKAKAKAFEWKQARIPYFLKEPTDLSTTLPQVLAFLVSLSFCLYYQYDKHWLANNLLGLAFSIQGIEHLSLGAVQTGVILLSGLFFYDIFWVFFTPVMVSVATSVDAPIKLLFPRPLEPDAKKAPFSMLGLGDIVIPGIFVALILRYDAKLKYASAYFRSAFVSYAAGLAATIAVMNYFSAAQPALLYIVPAVLGGTGLHALVKREFNLLYNHTEDQPKEKQAEKEGQSSAPGGDVVLQTKKAS